MGYAQQTGSLINHLHARGVKGQPTPVVGMGATLLSYTDRNPGTIVKVWAEGKFTYVQVQADDYQRTDDNGLSESQSYDYTPNPKGHVSTFRIKEGGLWQGAIKNAETGRWNKSDGCGLRIGEREKYHDFSF